MGHHIVTVTAETDLDPEEQPYGIPRVVFTCTASPADECHIYAGGPDWEEPDAVTTSHDECWAQGWFDNECATYTGPGAHDTEGEAGVPNVDRSGPVDVEWDWESGRFIWRWSAHVEANDPERTAT